MKKLIVAAACCVMPFMAGYACDITNCMTVTVDKSVAKLTFFSDAQGDTVQGGPWSSLQPGSYAWEPAYYNGQASTIYVGQAVYTDKKGQPVEVYGTYMVAFNSTTANAGLALSVVPGKNASGAACKVLKAVGSGVTVTAFTPIRNVTPMCTAT